MLCFFIYLFLFTICPIWTFGRISMLYSTFLVLLIHLSPWSLNEDWHIYKIVEPVILIGVAFLVLASSDLAIDPEFSR